MGLKDLLKSTVKRALGRGEPAAPAPEARPTRSGSHPGQPNTPSHHPKNAFVSLFLHVPVNDLPKGEVPAPGGPGRGPTRPACWR